MQIMIANTSMGIPIPRPTPNGSLRLILVPGFPYPLQEYPVQKFGQARDHAAAADAQSNENVEFTLREKPVRVIEDIFKLYMVNRKKMEYHREESDLIISPVTVIEFWTTFSGSKLTFTGIPALKEKSYATNVVGKEKLLRY